MYQKLKSFAKENKHIDVWLREDVPKEFHYSNNDRIGPIFITAKINYTLDTLYKSIPYYVKEYNLTCKTDFTSYIFYCILYLLCTRIVIFSFLQWLIIVNLEFTGMTTQPKKCGHFSSQTDQRFFQNANWNLSTT